MFLNLEQARHYSVELCRLGIPVGNSLWHRSSSGPFLASKNSFVYFQNNHQFFSKFQYDPKRLAKGIYLLLTNNYEMLFSKSHCFIFWLLNNFLHSQENHAFNYFPDLILQSFHFNNFHIAALLMLQFYPRFSHKPFSWSNVTFLSTTTSNTLIVSQGIPCKTSNLCQN